MLGESYGFKIYLGIVAVGILLYVIYRMRKPKEECCGEEKAKVVLFYQNGCSPCESLKPIWNQLVDAFEGKSVDLSKVDLAKNPVEGIDHTPTILAHKNGQTVKYNGPRTLVDLTNFVSSVM